MEILNNMSLSEINELNGSLTYGLTLYEVLRAPRIPNQAKYEDIDATLNGSGLREEISCPICSGIVLRCVVIKTCLHRFCLNCIQKCVRIGLHECPKCRKHVPSKRFLKADPIYDSIISRIVTNVEIFEKLSDAFTVAINKGIKNDPNIEMIRRNYLDKNPKVNIKDVESPNVLSLDEFWIQNKFETNVCKKDFKKRRTRIRHILPKSKDYDKLLYKLISDKTLPQIEPNGLCCDGSLTIHQLSMYIKTSINIPTHANMCIYLKESNYIPPLNVTLAFLRNKVCIMSHEVLNVYYGSPI
ncbi:uncharacterized protein TOT_040000102 [Theileria orientalis strain Shintoku]|uniref:RING-type domain-containing protein n=1 Tax=Theileria orientalis strain Shintoku TaxID=869250 RepID=J4C480_THEOR|nr:uncharacterized protein TOT_040000102 [Theileria orientalis strain Shintoku]BAM41721.1 uncharacterized protein TOT_040000102 [Theileria orientalis strain Shintoku]|eukprot:XP_009692022.1 uncharacterized protein TOT_040000102 [Theileria orientalis strain Shintoku]